MKKKYNEAVKNGDPQVHAMIGKSWEVNPKIKRESLEKDYERDPEGSKMKYESLTGETLIFTPDGAYRIAEMADNSIIRTEYGAREVQMFINSGTKKVYELHTEEGYTIRGSANHPLKVFSNKKNWKESSGKVWRTIGELRKGDKVCIDLNNDLFGEETISKDMALLLGGLITDGTFAERPDGRGYTTWFFDKDSELREIVENNHCGLFSESGNAEKMKETILQLYNDKHQCDLMGKNARIYVENHIDRKVAMDRFKELFEINV
jgi:intein/homing endonuclease